MSHRDNERVARLMKDFGDKCAVAKQSLMLRVQDRQEEDPDYGEASSPKKFSSL
jgi:hypothetical protein